jgi:CheY-like chemotaxis protein
MVRLKPDHLANSVTIRQVNQKLLLCTVQGGSFFVIVIKDKSNNLGEGFKSKMKAAKEGQARVFIADDQSRVRWALRTFLQEEPGLVLVGETSRAEALLALVEATRPDLLLLDWELSGQPIVDLLSALRALDFQIKIIVLSSQPDIQQTVLEARVDAFVSKGDPPERLLTTLRAMQYESHERPTH